MTATHSLSLTQLYQLAADCTRCDRMADRSAVLSRANGKRGARLMLVGEAPGRLGADKSGKPFVGDRSGENLFALLKAVGVDRSDVFITNAVLCCPTDGIRNYKPTAVELANCTSFLRATIENVSPRVVATLGRVALRQVCKTFSIRPPAGRLADIVARPIQADRFTVAPLFHPSPRVINSQRSFAQQSADLRRVLRLL